VYQSDQNIPPQGKEGAALQLMRKCLAFKAISLDSSFKPK